MPMSMKELFERIERDGGATFTPDQVERLSERSERVHPLAQQIGQLLAAEFGDLQGRDAIDHRDMAMASANVMAAVSEASAKAILSTHMATGMPVDQTLAEFIKVTTELVEELKLRSGAALALAGMLRSSL